MSFLYNLIGITVSTFLRLVAPFNSKLSLFVNGRKKTISILKNSISKNDRVIWIHAASLGEFEQGLPVMEQLKYDYPTHKILLTFFSPSGYEVKKNNKTADVICYLPLDTKKRVAQFLKAAQPELAIFIKYEIWPNYLAALKKHNIPTVLISALFKKKQIYFKWYGLFMRNSLSNFSHFFVQNNKSEILLNEIGYRNVTVAGDTRFDRVLEILQRENTLNFIHDFKDHKFCLVCGSTWPEDEKIIADFINQNQLSIKVIIAPHTIKPNHINTIKQSLNKPAICFSDLKNAKLKEYDVLILDTIGILTKTYSYADIAFVGGGFATGLHNTLEPAVFGIPVLIGPQYEGFVEAEDLVSLKGIISIENSLDFKQYMNKFYSDQDFKNKTGQINYTYINEQAGATKKIVSAIHSIVSQNN